MTPQQSAAKAGAAAAMPSGKSRPIILIVPDLTEVFERPTESAYVVRANYAEAITGAGGQPLILPYDADNLEAALVLADGIVLTGTQPGASVADWRRTFERQLVEKALALGRPLLGICHGMQLIGEHLGGNFVTELPGNAVMHLPQEIPDELAHEIVVEPGSVLADFAGTGPSVNSLHSHALSGEGRFRVVARAEDGVVEAFEGETDGFCLGVQWHPEYRLTDLDRGILKLFVARSAEAAARRSKVEESLIVRKRLASLGFSLPEASVPPGAFVGAVRHGNVVTVSGQVPLINGAIWKTGQVGAGVSIEEGCDCARICMLNILSQLETAAGGFENVRGFVRLAGYVASGSDFTRHGAIVDGASEMLRELFPDRWQHARIAIGVSSLPRGAPVEIELTALVAGEV